MIRQIEEVSSPNAAPRESDAVNYGTSLTYCGNVTQANTPCRTINTCNDATGKVTTQSDNNAHSVSVATSSLTDFTLPDTLRTNTAASLQTQAAYNSPNFLPVSVAGPGQTLNNGKLGHGGVHLL